MRLSITKTAFLLISALLLTSCIGSSPEGNPQPLSSAPASSSAPLKLIGYNFTLNDVGDGWNEGKVYLAFENTSDSFASGEDFDLSGAIVETQEGKNYPVEVWQEFQYASGHASKVDFGVLPRVVPPHFRWSSAYIAGAGIDTGTYFLQFRAAVAAHPLRITFPTRPDLNFELDSFAQSSLAFPASASVLEAAKPLSALAGKVLADDPSGLRVTLDGTGAWESNAYIGLFLDYTVVNNDNLDSHKIDVMSPFLAYYDDNGLIVTYLQETPGISKETFSFEAGPAQSGKYQIKLLYGGDTYDCNPNVFTAELVESKYILYKLDRCN